MRCTNLIWGVVFWSACTEYKLNADDRQLPGADTGLPATDTAPPLEPGSCDDWSPGPAGEVTPDKSCVNEPVVGTWKPVIEWQWQSNKNSPGYDQIMSTPAIGNLTDDNGDGKVNEDDVPDIVFTSFSGGAYSSAGALTAISGDGSGELWSLTSLGAEQVYASGGVAIGDIDADGAVEVCVAGYTQAVVCVSGSTGALKWAAGSERAAYGAPAIADMDGDGLAEVTFGRQIFSHDGTPLGIGAGGVGGNATSIPVDMDSDGQLELLAGNTAYEMDGTTMWTDGGSDGFAAVGDFDLDGRPDVVKARSGIVTLTDNDGTQVWQVGLSGGGGGPPTVADFDGDGYPEVGVAGAYYYVVFDTDGSQLWANPVRDYSSSVTGSSVFDFEGDGAAEVVYGDEHTLWVFDGATGAVELELADHASGTLYEYPLIADVDADGSTEIIVASNNYAFSGWNGITVIGDADSSWASARPTWNQYAYSITNVNDDGTIPVSQEPNWLTWNTFRAGGTLDGLSHWLTDIAPGDVERCTETCDTDRVSLSLRVRNQGRLSAPPTQASLVRADGVAILDVAVGALLSGEEQVLSPIEISREDWGSGSLTLVTESAEQLAECDEENNTLDLGAWPCADDR